MIKHLKTKTAIKVFGLLFLSFIALIFLTNCKSQEKTQSGTIPLSELYSIFGQAKGETSGVSNVSQTGDGMLISYKFYPANKDELANELGVELAPKIKEFYKKIKGPNKVAFEVFIPTSPEAISWQPFVSFVVTRKLAKQTSWTAYEDKNLLNVVQDVRYYR